MKKRFFRDGLQKLIFPWLTPHPTSTSSEIGYFQETISAADYLETAKRNQVGFNITFIVAQDAIAGGFQCVDSDGKVLKEFNDEVQKLCRKKKIEHTLMVAFARARLYGSAGIFIGFGDSSNLMDEKAYGSRVEYLYALPEDVISGRTARTNAAGQNTFPLELASYEITAGKNSIVDASRIVHIQPFTIVDDFDGTPAMEPVYDLLTILKNADWSTGQSIFRHASGLTFITAGAGASQAQIDAIDESVANVNAKSIVTLTPGCGVSSASGSAIDPTSTYNVMMGQISAGCNIPVSILIGAQSGQGVSENDRRDYGDFLHGLQQNTLTDPLRQILDLFQESRQLPKQEFKIEWNLRSIFMIESSRAKLYDARTDVEKKKEKEVEARAALYSARAKYWRGYTEQEKEKFELESEGRQFEEGEREEGRKGESEESD
jgi:hypothetical protein